MNNLIHSINSYGTEHKILLINLPTNCIKYNCEIYSKDRWTRKFEKKITDINSEDEILLLKLDKNDQNLFYKIKIKRKYMNNIEELDFFNFIQIDTKEDLKSINKNIQMVINKKNKDNCIDSNKNIEEQLDINEQLDIDEQLEIDEEFNNMAMNSRNVSLFDLNNYNSLQNLMSNQNSQFMNFLNYENIDDENGEDDDEEEEEENDEEDDEEEENDDDEDKDQGDIEEINTNNLD